MSNRIISFIVNFAIRAVFGLSLIFFINEYLVSGDSGIFVGINGLSFLTTGTLGIPGVCLLYAIVFYQTL